MWPRADRRGADTACGQGEGEETVEQPHLKEGAFRVEAKGLGTKKAWMLSSQLFPSEAAQLGNLKDDSSQVARRSCRSE